MNRLEVLLLILGFIFVSLSFFISEKQAKKEKKELSELPSGKEIWTKKDEAIVKKQVADIIQEQSFEVIEETKDRLNQMSNEKIMSVDEFSNQIIEKIEQNHKEVVFMYNMLNEKEKELKQLVLQKPKTNSKKASIISEQPTAIQTILNKPNSKENKEVKVTDLQEKQEVKKVNKDKETPITNTNEKIRALYESGKTILEISKAMKLGQGEVKLVIDLYGGKHL